MSIYNFAPSTTSFVSIANIECGVCNIPFGIPEALQEKSRNEGTFFYCPNGHQIHYYDTENKKLRDQLARERHHVDQAKAEAKYQEERAARNWEAKEQIGRQLSSTKGVVTRIKRRSSHGVCLYCRRTFENLQDHMVTKHPKMVKTKTAKGEKDATARGFRTNCKRRNGQAKRSSKKAR